MGGDSFGASSPVSTGEDDFYVDDFDDFATLSPLVGESNERPSWVEPDDLKLVHRIGRGLFGDVWLATLHNSTEEFDEFHEVAVKMLPLLSDENIRIVLAKFQSLYHASQGLKHVNWPQGITTKNGKACIVFKFCEGSVGDKMARLPGNRLSLEDALRYGADLVRGIVELHSCGLLALNLKPCNFLLDDQGNALVGEFGTPILFFENSATKSQPVPWMGTPSYMAPEQWAPSVRGPVSNETDAWGFACSMVEMVSGTKPWNCLTADEIFTAVVLKHEKPAVPPEFPPAVRKMLNSCFEYDYRQRPSFKEIMRAFMGPDDIFKEGDWITVKDRPDGELVKIGIVKAVVGSDSVYLHSCDKPGERIQITGASRLSLWKDKFRIDDFVRVKETVHEPRFGWPEGVSKAVAIVEGFKEQEGIVLVTFPDSTLVWKADPLELERVSGGFAAGDWVLLRSSWPANAEEGKGQGISNVGTVHYVESDGALKVAFLGRETLWTGQPDDFEKALPLSPGQFIRLRSNVVKPRFEWRRSSEHGGGSWDLGRVINIVPNGGLEVDFPGRFWNQKGWWADPEEVEVVRIQEIEGLVKKYQHIESMHWGIRPLLSLIGFLVVARAGVVVVKVVSKPFRGKGKEEQRSRVAVPAAEQKSITGTLDRVSIPPGKEPPVSGNSNPAWLPPHVATLIFRDGNFRTL